MGSMEHETRKINLQFTSTPTKKNSHVFALTDFMDSFMPNKKSLAIVPDNIAF